MSELCRRTSICSGESASSHQTGSVPAVLFGSGQGVFKTGRYLPGLGHPVHKVEDPRTPRLLAIAEEEGLRGPHLRLYEAVGRVHEQVLGGRLPLNGAGVCGAA